MWIEVGTVLHSSEKPAIARSVINSIRTTRSFLVLAFIPLLLLALGGYTFYLNTASQADKEARAHTESVAKIISSRTSSFINNLTHSAQLMAGEKAVIEHLTTAESISSKIATPILKRYCATLQASICYLMIPDGTAVADNRPAAKTIVGNNYGFRPYFKLAMNGQADVHPALGVTTKKRGLYFSSPVFNQGKIIGAAIIKFPPDTVESYLKNLAGNAVLTDTNGVIFAANREDWLYQSLLPLTEQQRQQIKQSRQFGDKEPDNIGLKFNAELDTVTDSIGRKFLLYQAAVEALPGWNINYLLQPEHLITSEQKKKNLLYLILFILLFFCTLLAVWWLYNNLQFAIRNNSRYQKALEESKLRLQRFEDVSDEAIFIHDGGRPVDANKQAEKLLGYNHTELLELDLAVLFSDDSKAIAEFNAKQNITTQYQAEMLSKTGEKIPVIITGQPDIWNGRKVRAVSIRDIRQQIETQQKLTASEDRFRQLSDMVADGIIIYTQQNITNCNQALCDILGYRKSELISSAITRIFDLDQLTLIGQAQAAVEINLLTKEGTLLPVEVSAAQLQFSEGLYQALSVRDISRQKAQEERILYHAQYDLLTGIPNRFLARDRIEHALKSAHRNRKQVALLFIDLNDFKKVNDSLGHDVGDKLLQAVTSRVSSCIRENDTLSRHGGDEFLILIEDLAFASDADQVLEKVLQQFQHPFAVEGRELLITTSIGVAIYPQDAEDYHSLVRAADIAMYQAKSEGKNQFHFYTQEMNKIAQRQLELDTHLDSALGNNEFSLVFQPLLTGQSENAQQVHGAEVLLRWNSPELGAVSPAEFIPLTEQSGQIVQIGNWVLEKACQTARSWMDSHQRDFYLSVNVSPRQFRAGNFAKKLQKILEVTDFPADKLNLEVTEGLFIEAGECINQTLNEITRMGVGLSMDDFGTGYSSLSYLQTFPFSNLKIDRSFVNELPENKDSDILVTTAIAMAHGLGLSVTAEGVETSAQLDHLKQAGCDYLQGYLIGKPVGATEFELCFLQNELPHKEDDETHIH